MKRSEIRARIEHNLTEADFIINELRLQPDPFRGWHLVIVSSSFAGLSNRERRETALKGLVQRGGNSSPPLTPPC